MAEFWSSLSGGEQFFYLIALVSTGIMFFFLLLNLVGFVGGDVDMHDGGTGDGGDGSPHPSGLGLLSLRTVLAFMVGFGWTGAGILEAGQPMYIAVVAAVVVGQIFMMAVFWLMRVLHGMAESGTADPKQAEGKTGTVYTPIPPKGEGTGQIQVMVEGRLREHRAISEERVALPTGSSVKVVKVLDGNTMVVEALRE